MSLHRTTFPSPLGELRAVLCGDTVLALAFADSWTRIEANLGRRIGGRAVPAAPSPGLAAALARYFGGDPEALACVPLDPGGTAFQRAVWSALVRVPAGASITYEGLAREVGSPGAARAAGAACGANPIWLGIPCHRALGNRGQLTGYAGGIARKRWLLAHEGTLPRAGDYAEAPSFASAVVRAQR